MSGILMMSVGNSYGSLPVNTVAPAVTGTAAVGQTLTTTSGTWTGAPTPTFTYQWQRNTTNISGETSTTYIAQFADIGSTLRCVVTATNSLGAVSANSNNTGTVAAPAIGDAAGGGFYAGQIGVSGVATHYLIVGPRSSAQGSYNWKNSNTNTTGTSSDIDGPTNSANMNNSAHPGAQFCEALTIGGFTDWYMPAKNELEICYFNLKPGTTSNTTVSGINPNAVPARASNYTGGNPAQTSATSFQTSGAEAFSASGTYYWCSTQTSTTQAASQDFQTGFQDTGNKDNPQPTRAVRRIPV
jgi:hypothetical protein